MNIIIFSIYLFFISISLAIFVYVKINFSHITKIKFIQKKWNILFYIILINISLWFIILYFYNEDIKNISIKNINSSEIINY